MKGWLKSFIMPAVSGGCRWHPAPPPASRNRPATRLKDPEMSSKNHRLCSSLLLLFTTGLAFLLPGQPLTAQNQNLFDCVPNAAGDGWVCTPQQPPGPADPDRVGGVPGNAGTDRAPATADPIPVPSAVGPQAAVTAPPSSNSQSAPGRGNELDWVPRDRLTQGELANLPSNCCGAFIEPPREPVDAGEDPASTATYFESAAGFRRGPDDTIEFDGVVRVRQGSRTARNDQTTVIDGETGTVRMAGNVEFREPGVLMRGDTAVIDRESGSNRLDNARYVLHEYGAHGAAESLVYASASNQLTIVNGEFSRCEPESNFWRLSAASIVIDQQAGRGYARGTSLRIRDVPVFYYPFALTFPLSDQRVSGFLAPSLGSTREGGVDLQVPYYFALAPHYDATLSPRLIADRGILVNGEVRYLASWSMNTLNVAHLAGDKEFVTDASGTPTLLSPPGEDRWFIGFEHEGSIGDNWRTLVDYNAVSDYAYFEDFGSSGLNVASRTHLNRQGRVDFNSQLLSGRLNVQRTQVLDPLLDPRFAESDLNRPFDRLPQLLLNTGLPLPGRLRFDLSTQFTHFDRELDEEQLTAGQLQAGALVNGTRLNVEPALSWSVERPGWFVRPTARYRHLAYDLQDQGVFTDADAELGVGVFSLDSGLIFERPMDLGNGYVQTLEPRLYYLYSEYEDQSTLPLFDTTEYSFSFNQLFRDQRFSGGDRITNADQLTTAVTSRILDPTGRERARASLGQIHYFEDRLVGLSNPLQNWMPLYSTTSSSSALLGEFSYAFSDSWRASGDIQWDEDRQEVNEGSFQFNFQSADNLIFNIAYRYRDIVTLPGFLLSPEIDPRINQTDVSGILPLNNNWRLLGRWNYDHANSRNLETFAGVEYSNCCTTIRLVAREWVRQYQLFLPDIEPDRGIFFQFTLNGLGNIAGGGLSNLLSDSIAGFRDPYQP